MDGSGHLPGIDILTGFVMIALSVIGIAFFASSEAAIISLSKLRIRTLSEQGKSNNAQLLERLIHKQDRLVATILLAENGLIIFAATIWAYMAFFLVAHKVTWPVILVTTATLTAAVVLIGSIIPKTFAAQNAERYALMIARPLSLVVRLMSPFVWIFASVTRVYVHMCNVVFRTQQVLTLPLVATDEELRMLLNDVQKHGVLEREETEMIQSVIYLSETSVREIMVPRIDMVCLPADATFDEALRVAISEGHSRIPVYQDSSDNIIGILYVKDLLAILQGDERPHGIPSAYIRPAYHVPESKKVDELLKSMRNERVHLAIVLDEFGGTAGLVTIEDILEEIVGDIQDEYDSEEGLPVQHQPDGSLIVEGLVSIDEVSDLLGVRLPTEDFDTIGGFVVGLLGRAPQPDEEVVYDGVRLQILEVEQRRVARIQIWRRNTAPLHDLDAAIDSMSEQKQ
ncbi:MAG: hemolysin family protein [Candidatus Sericytochromatia bacterium]